MKRISKEELNVLLESLNIDNPYTEEYNFGDDEQGKDTEKWQRKLDNDLSLFLKDLSVIMKKHGIESIKASHEKDVPFIPVHRDGVEMHLDPTNINLRRSYRSGGTSSDTFSALHRLAANNEHKHIWSHDVYRKASAANMPNNKLGFGEEQDEK